MSALLTDYIISDPAICGGKPTIAGSRVRVQDIYLLHELQGMSLDEILEGYPQLSPTQIYSALAYYWDHRDEIDAQMQAADELIKQLKQQQGLSALQRKLAKHHGTNG